MRAPAAFIVGAGPGLGVSLARRLARAGVAVGLIARTGTTVRAAVAALSGTDVEIVGRTADATDETALRSALDDLTTALGPPEVLVYNAGLIQKDRLGELTADQHLHAWAVNVVGAITAAAHIAPRMAELGRGTILITGGMPVPLPDLASLSLGKAGVRALTELLAAQFGPSGVHVATVTIAGAVAARTRFDPDAIAEQYWRLHQQSRGEWEHEVVFHGVPG